MPPPKSVSSPMARKKTKRSAKSRASWAGMLRFGLVSIPVQAINAHAKEQGQVTFHQLHATCHSRIRYEKVCPIHGPVDNDEIVLGFEYSKNRYIEVDPEELDKLRTDAERALTIDTFIAPEQLDPIYYDGRMYYLTPDGATAKEPYAVFLEALKNRNRYGIGQVVFSGREQVVAVRPLDDALLMAMLNYAPEIRAPESAVGELPAIRGSDKKTRLAEQLIESWSDDHFDFSDYEDEYFDKVRQLINAKRKGHEIVAPEEEQEEPEVVNLMDALRKSVARTSHNRRSKKKSRSRATGSHRAHHAARRAS